MPNSDYYSSHPAPPQGNSPYQGYAHPLHAPPCQPADGSYNPLEENGLPSIAPQNPPGPKYPDNQPPPYTFEEKFAIPNPKYKDLWAAIVFVLDFFGLIVVSGISLNAYRVTERTNGRGIYDNRRNDFSVSRLARFMICTPLGLLTEYIKNKAFDKFYNSFYVCASGSAGCVWILFHAREDVH
jgi:hypothetical protein